MNLIEQLGGYDKTKEYLKKNSHFINFEGLERFYDGLLEYRRENGIFEVGDYVVMDSYKSEYQFYQISEDDIGSHWFNLVEFRHATDEEIEVGHRI